MWLLGGKQKIQHGNSVERHVLMLEHLPKGLFIWLFTINQKNQTLLGFLSQYFFRSLSCVWLKGQSRLGQVGPIFRGCSIRELEDWVHPVEEISSFDVGSLYSSKMEKPIEPTSSCGQVGTNNDIAGAQA